jgi:L-alanine-DL-glutamate epimerase-like enolase superfamily enzyme
MTALDASIIAARVSFVLRPFRTPLQLSSGPISEITEAQAEVRVRVGGHEGVGRGSIYLSDLWAWPAPQLTHDLRAAMMQTMCKTIAAELSELCGGEAAHPLELGMRLHDAVMRLEGWGEDEDEKKPIPALVRAVCLSPFDAAIHDAVGQASGISAFAFYAEHETLPTADTWFPEHGVVAAIAATLQPPQPALTAWMVVGTAGASDAELRAWVCERGYHAFKLKVNGRDNAIDVARTVDLYRTAKTLGVERPRLCVDSNCANPDADSVRDYLERLRATDAETYAALEYVEQPTGRDIEIYRYDWRPVTALKPVLLDEGLTGLEQMEIAAQQGWSGFAIKTCKGHSFSLVAAAWARQRGMLLVQQDLTNPGLAAIHSFLCAAHLPVINGIELNSPQFTPAANAEWLPRLASLFEPTDGNHRLPGAVPAGLGSKL